MPHVGEDTQVQARDLLTDIWYALLVNLPRGYAVRVAVGLALRISSGGIPDYDPDSRSTFHTQVTQT